MGVNQSTKSKTGSDDPLCDAPSPCEGLAEGNCGATAPAGQYDAQQALALAGKAEKTDEAWLTDEAWMKLAEKPHDEGSAVGQLIQLVEYFCEERTVWLATDVAWHPTIIAHWKDGDLHGGASYYLRDGKDEYWVDFEEFEQQDCSNNGGGRKRSLRVVDRVVVWDNPRHVIADRSYDMVPRRDFNWQWHTGSGTLPFQLAWENMPHPMNEQMKALVEDGRKARGTHHCTHTWKSPYNNKVKRTIYSIDLDSLTQTNPDSNKTRPIRMVYDVSQHEGAPQPKLPDHPVFDNQLNDSESIDPKPSGTNEARSDRPQKDSWNNNDAWTKKKTSWKHSQGWDSQAWSSNQKGGDDWGNYSKSSTQGSKQDDQGSPPAQSWYNSSGAWADEGRSPPRPHQ